MHNIFFPNHSHEEYVARYLDKVLCCHYSSYNIHTYSRSEYIKKKTSKVTVARQKKTDEGQADSGVLSCTCYFSLQWPAFVAFPE